MQSRTRVHLPHDSRAGKTPCRARSGSPSPCKLGETKASMDAKVSLEPALSKTMASMHANVSPGLFHRKRSETNASMDAIISLGTALSETKVCMHTFVSLRSHPHSRPQDEATAFIDVLDRFGLGTQRIGPIRMNRYSDGVGSVGLNRFRRNRSRIEAHRRLNRSPSHASTHRLVRRIGQDGSTTR